MLEPSAATPTACSTRLRGRGYRMLLVMPGFIMPGIHGFRARKTWMAGTSPAMTA